MMTAKGLLGWKRAHGRICNVCPTVVKKWLAGHTIEMHTTDMHGSGFNDSPGHKPETNIALYNEHMQNVNRHEEVQSSKQVGWDAKNDEKHRQNKDGSHGLQKSTSVLQSGLHTSLDLGYVWEPNLFWQHYHQFHVLAYECECHSIF